MFSVEELLEPIDASSPSGKDLRYDPVMDAIQEARAEEDDSLPMGEWTRQAKRADYALVASLTRNALLKSSKDLWLAVWLGEATLKNDNYAALEPVLTFLIELQKHFWPTLFPEIEEGDHSLRAAPLHWGLTRYTKLLHEFPITSNGVSYETHKAIRAGSLQSTEDETTLTAEKLDAAIGATSKSFYVQISEALNKAQARLDELYLFCEENYAEEGPSFVSLRTALEELQNLSSQFLRLKQAQEPDLDPIIPPHPTSVEQESTPALTESYQEEANLSISAVEVTPPPPEQQASMVTKESALHSWEEAMQLLARCADFVAENHAAHPTAYLLALALQMGRESFEESAPTSQTRLNLKRAVDTGNWEELLKESFAALRQDFGTRWLDLYRYIWQGSQALGSNTLSELSLLQARFLMERNSEAAQSFFVDDTPVANQETQRWLSQEVLAQENPETNATTTLFLRPETSAPEQMEDDPYEVARALAIEGNLTAAVRQLLAQSPSTRSPREDFLRRVQVCRLLLEMGRREAAVPMLRQLLHEIQNRQLETWEEPSVLSEVFSLLLQALPPEEDDRERVSVYSLLCRLDPAMALTLQPVA